MVGEPMKKVILLMCLILLTTSCDNPQRTRLSTTVNNGNGLAQPNGPTTNPWGTSTTGTVTGGTTGTTSGTTSTKPPGFENCDISPSHLYAAGVNWMGICQSTLDETSIAVQPTVTDTARTCLIPTYKDNTGSSTYLGQPQCFAPQANSVTMGKLYKTRSGFTGSPINGLMVMKEVSLGAYFTCMDAYITFAHPSCPYGAKTNAYCDQMARASMTTKCNNFKADHSYIDVCLKRPYGLCN
jgi:hypothetical protein